MSEHQSGFGPLIDTRVRVLTWNLWWRFGPWEKRQPAIAATLEKAGADVLCLQEVWDDGRANQAAVLAERLGLHHAYATRFDDYEEKMGNAVLSRWPIARSEWRPLPAASDAEEFRTVLFAEIDGPRGPIQVFCTHLNWRRDQSAIRQLQVRAIAGFIDSCRPRSFPPVLCGDLNADPTSDEVRMLTGQATVPVDKLVFHDAWDAAGDGGPGFTWSNENPYARLDLEPDRRIDYLLTGWPKAGGAGHALHCELVGTEPVDGVAPSDHYGLVADLRY